MNEQKCSLICNFGKRMKNLVMILVLALGFLVAGNAQTSVAKFNLKAGFATFKYVDEIDINQGGSHPSQFIGFDIALQTTRGVFMPGFHYYKIGIAPENFSIGEIFKERKYMHYARIPISFGYAFEAGKLLEFMPYGGANANFFITADENNLGLNGDKFHGVQAGLQAGVRVKALNHITLDATYSHSFNPRLKTRDESITRGWIFLVGFVF